MLIIHFSNLTDFILLDCFMHLPEVWFSVEKLDERIHEIGNACIYIALSNFNAKSIDSIMAKSENSNPFE
jgi:hypothetical protein